MELNTVTHYTTRLALYAYFKIYEITKYGLIFEHIHAIEAHTTVLTLEWTTSFYISVQINLLLSHSIVSVVTIRKARSFLTKFMPSLQKESRVVFC